MIPQTTGRRTGPYPNTIYRDARLCYQSLGNAELDDLAEALAYEAEDVDGLYGGDPVAALLATERRRAARDEQARRRRLFAAGRDLPDPDAASHQVWRDLARQVRERADIVDVFRRGGYHVERVGTNSRRGDEEWAAACLVCAGADRMRIWRGPNGRYWCRRCGLSGDVVSIARTLLPDCRSWHAAVRHLAAEVGLAVPAPIGPQPAVGTGWAPTPIRGGGRRGR